MANRFISHYPPGAFSLESNPYWLRLLVVTAVLLLSGLLVYIVPTDRLILLLLLAPAAGAALIFLKKPPLGLVALMAGGLVVPLAIGTGTDSGVNVTVLLLPLLVALWLFDEVAGRSQLRFIWSRPFLPLIGLVVVATLSFLAGQLPWIPFTQHAPLPAQAAGLAIFFLSAAAFLLVAHQVQGMRWLQVLTWLFLALGALYILGRLLPGSGRFILALYHLGAIGSLFWTWLVALSFSQALFNRQLHTRWRLALAGLPLALFYVSLYEARPWSSGWLPPLIAMIAVLWAARPRLGLAVTCAAVVVAALNVQTVGNLFLIGDNLYSYTTRLEAWRILGEIIRVNPILGLGPANYYWYTPLYSILGWNVQFNSHNQYVDIVAQTGLLGLAFFLWFVWEMGRLGWRLRTEAAEGFPRAYVYGAFGGLVGTLVAGLLADWFLPFVYNVGLAGFRSSVLGWLFLGGLVALEQMKGHAAPEDRKNPLSHDSLDCHCQLEHA